MGQLERLLDMMHGRLVTRKASNYRIDSLYRIVKENYSQCILEEVDRAILDKINKEACDTNVQDFN